jgi:hypothetical protein
MQTAAPMIHTRRPMRAVTAPPVMAPMQQAVDVMPVATQLNE